MRCSRVYNDDIQCIKGPLTAFCSLKVSNRVRGVKLKVHLIVVYVHNLKMFYNDDVLMAVAIAIYLTYLYSLYC